jgi:hypothetical protein
MPVDLPSGPEEETTLSAASQQACPALDLQPYESSLTRDAHAVSV